MTHNQPLTQSLCRSRWKTNNFCIHSSYTVSSRKEQSFEIRVSEFENKIGSHYYLGGAHHPRMVIFYYRENHFDITTFKGNILISIKKRLCNIILTSRRVDRGVGRSCLIPWRREGIVTGDGIRGWDSLSMLISTLRLIILLYIIIVLTKSASSITFIKTNNGAKIWVPPSLYMRAVSREERRNTHSRPLFFVLSILHLEIGSSVEP